MAVRILPGTSGQAQAPFDGSIAVSKYDLMFLDTDDVKPASSQADQLTEPLNQALFAQRFAGLAGDTRKAADVQAISTFPLLTHPETEFPCASATFEIGDLLAPVESAGGTALENQKLVKTTDPALAIAYATKRYASATTSVQCQFFSRVFPLTANKADFEVSIPVIPHASLTEQNLFTAREALQVVAIDVVPDLVQGGALTGTVVKAVSTATPVKTTTPMHAADAIDFNATAHTVQPMSLTATTADLILKPGDRIGLDLSAALSTGRANITIRFKRL